MKNKLYLFGLFLSILAGCSEDDNIATNPEGAIDLSMQKGNKNSTLGGFMYIDVGNNFITSNEDTYIVPFGAVKGLENVSMIPKSGWSKKVAVILGSGYVVCHGNQFYRLLVKGYSMDTFNEITGVNLQYQTPFTGPGGNINLSTDLAAFTPFPTLPVDISLDNSQIEPFDIVFLSAGIKWCSAYLKPVLDNTTLSMHLIISAKPYPDIKKTNDTNRETTITIRGITKTEKKVKVTQEGVDPYIKLTGGISSPIYYEAKKESYSIWIETNLSFNDWGAKSDNEAWFNVKKSSTANNLNDITIEADIKANSSGKARDGKIVLYSADYGINDTIRIIQKP
ncbi:hypothetical protein EZS27_002751 [termite gut metagenome]|uniref:BACON domain-containing protein n=1 Tax=termite gut metagenome TaxID=433724 RepID=A0A5J4SXC6_9ZZZZ